MNTYVKRLFANATLLQVLIAYYICLYYNILMYRYSYYTPKTYSYGSASTAAAMFTAGFIIFYLLVIIAAYVYSGITLGKIFKKAGQPSWAAWVPFYNVWKFLELGSLPGALVFLTLVPGLGALALAVLMQVSAYRIGQGFGKGGEFVLLSIFLAPVWFGILAFGKAQWNGGIASNPVAPIAPIQPQQPTNTQQY